MISTPLSLPGSQSERIPGEVGTANTLSSGIMKKLAIFSVMCFFLAKSTDTMSKAGIKREHPAARTHRDLNKKSIECIVHELGPIAQPTFENIEIPKRLTCGTENHGPTLLLVGDYKDFFDQPRIYSGAISLSIPTQLISAELVVDLADPLSYELISISEKSHHEGRSLIDKHDGYFKTLIVRISDKYGHSPTYSAAELSKQVFTNKSSMTKQYQACSNGQLSFTPALDGADIVNGVVDLVVDNDLSYSGFSHQECVSAADNAITLNYDIGTTHTYIMYICPDVVDFGIAAGVADIGGKKSWFKNEFSSYPYVQMHELGHNLVFFHSGEGAAEYGDPTGIMGGYYNTDVNFGKMCFNAAKTWATGWYSDRHATVNPTSNSYVGSVVDINTVVNNHARNADHVVVKVADKDEANLYFMLHRLEGITSDMKEEYIETHANGINIIRHAYTGMPSSKIGHLVSGDEFVKENWSNTGKDLYIKVCSIAPDSAAGGAKVLVYLNGTRKPSCNDDATASSVLAIPAFQISGFTPNDNEQDDKDESASSSSCNDSRLEIKINTVLRTCDWVAKKSKPRCKKSGVPSHCPKTCDEVLCNADSTMRFKIIKNNIGFQSCTWVGKTFKKQRCKLDNGHVMKTCRQTCAKFA